MVYRTSFDVAAPSDLFPLVQCVDLQVIPADAKLKRSGVEYMDDRGNMRYGTYFLCPFCDHPISFLPTSVIARYEFNPG
jgi:hypothetical protein